MMSLGLPSDSSELDEEHELSESEDKEDDEDDSEELLSQSLSSSSLHVSPSEVDDSELECLLNFPQNPSGSSESELDELEEEFELVPLEESDA